jgi:hypothetical protein
VLQWLFFLLVIVAPLNFVLSCAAASAEKPSFKRRLPQFWCLSSMAPITMATLAPRTFVKLSNGYLYQRNILVRVVDESMYPLQWKQFVRWKEEYGLFQIAPHAIVEGDEAGWEGSKEEEELHRRRNQEIWDRLAPCYLD